MLELSFNNVVKYLEAHHIFDDLSFTIYDNEKVGIVGSNGCGKTTILKMIAGIEEMTRHDSGSMSIPKGKSIGYLQQMHDYREGALVRDVIMEAFEPLKEVELEMKEIEEELKEISGVQLERKLKRYSYLQGAFEAGGGYEQEEKLSRVCKGLKIEEEFLKKDFSILSGGEKTTVVLAKILLETPDILLLDEPTNHLDMDSAEWLEEYIKNYRGMVIIVSHDRYFLDNTVGKIIDIEFMSCKTYKGNYSDFVKQKDEEIMKHFHDYQEQQKKIKAMKEQIKKLRDWAIRADNNKFFKRAASIQIRLDKIQRIDKPKFEKDRMKVDLKESTRSGNEVIVAKELCKSFEDKKLFDKADLLVQYRDRAALIGPNGCGKTTFLKMLLGEEEIDSGILKVGASINGAYLPQNVQFDDGEATVIQCFREDFEILEGKAREYLSKFFFFGADPYKKVKHLSGGEKIRLKLAILLYKKVNLLILDEPTNHLDIESIEAVENALEDFGGTIFFISHDRYFINKMSSKIVDVRNQKLKVYEGNFDQYKKLKEKEESMQIKSTPKIVEEKSNGKKKVRNRSQEDVERDRVKIEKKIEEKEFELSNIDEAMESSAGDYVKLQELMEARKSIDNEIENLMEKWEELNI